MLIASSLVMPENISVPLLRVLTFLQHYHFSWEYDIDIGVPLMTVLR